MLVDKAPTKLGFLVFPGFPMSCLTSAIEPLRAANEIAGNNTFAWQLVSECGERVVSSAKIGFDADTSLDEVQDLDTLFLLSRPCATFESAKSSNGCLRHLSRHGVNMGGVSGGVFPLARAGLLNGYTSSVHWCYEAAFAAEFPGHAMTDDVIVVDRRRYSVSGAAAFFDLMLHFIENRLGDDVSTEVACWFQHPLVRGQGVRQKIPTIRSESTTDMLPFPVARAISIFAEHIEYPLTITEVAKTIGVSSRQLERSFKIATGQSPLCYYRDLRLNKARQKVMYSNDTMSDVALSVGYTTAARMAQNYRRTFGVSPKEEREKINHFRVQNNRSVPSP
jgi:transcriptional regulator GlxA family with amidase domain